MKAPFPWFGGKRRVAPLVWAAFGDVHNYIEPFAGSLAVLLERPAWHKHALETVNDLDRYIANFWRALALDPSSVAAHCDWPVNEADLEARHLWLVNTGRERIEKMFADPDFFDAKVAGWWVWGLCQWIGSGWCSGRGPSGVHRKRPHLGDAGTGVHRQRPHLGDAGRGVHGPDGITNSGGSGAPRNEWDRSLAQDGDSPVLAYFRALAARLRKVRVCCGDWARVVTDGATKYGDTVGVFLDPPYSGALRAHGLYAEDGPDVSTSVREWAISKGDDKRFRIVLAGYEGEHVMPATWRTVAWSSSGGYAPPGTRGDSNRHLERLWLSPHCLVSRAGMFD